MAYTNSNLVTYTRLSPNYNSRNNKIKKITIHHMAGNFTVEQCGNGFAAHSRKASSNYGIGSDGRIAMYVEEKNRAWTSSNATNDHQAITIEVANNTKAPNWTVSDAAYASLIKLCIDICKRNGIDQLVYTGDATGNLTTHKMFANTNCPGKYLESKIPEIVEEVNKALKTTTTTNPSSQGNNKSNEEIANEVIQGKWGNGTERKNKLIASGYDYATIQAIVNQKLSGKKSIDEVAKEVIQGKWGVGSERKNKLTAAGYNYSIVQAKVNELLKK